MKKMTLVLIAVLLASLALLTANVAAQPGTNISGTYIRINNGRTIVTNPGQQPQIVVQFGNRNRNSELILANVECGVQNTIGTPGALFGGPFRFVQALDEFVPAPGFPPRADLYSFGYNALTGEVIDSVNLIPGQNYNVAFNVNITAPRGSRGFVECTLYSGYDVILAEAIPSTIVVR